MKVSDSAVSIRNAELRDTQGMSPPVPLRTPLRTRHPLRAFEAIAIGGTALAGTVLVWGMGRPRMLDGCVGGLWNPKGSDDLDAKRDELIAV